VGGRRLGADGGRRGRRTRATLVAAVWPDEPHLRPESAKNRVNVAISTLRTLGLGPLLRAGPGGGHLLAPEIPVRVE
jgi:hypothetical protein